MAVVVRKYWLASVVISLAVVGGSLRAAEPKGNSSAQPSSLAQANAQAVANPAAAQPQVTLAPKHQDGVTVLVDGKLFTEYWPRNGAKPILYPVVGPSNVEMTRQYPMKYVDSERRDHPHQRALWFTHGSISGVDFWSETGRHGTVEHREYLRQEADGNRAVVSTRNDWLGPDGKRVMQDDRTLTFIADGDVRIIDFDITLKATDGPVVFGDTKEGSMGFRVPSVMEVDPPKDGQHAEGHGGTIVNSAGQTNRDAWAQRAPWVDYHGLVDGQRVGVAMLNHPSSFRFPTYWHVRTYGLLAANPWGIGDFDPQSSERGDYTLPAGEKLELRYRLIFHTGDAKDADIAAHYEKYAAEAK